MPVKPKPYLIDQFPALPVIGVSLTGIGSLLLLTYLGRLIPVGDGSILPGIVAIVVTALAAQYLFKKRVASPDLTLPRSPRSSLGDSQLAIAQQGAALKARFKNITRLLPAFCPEDGGRVPCVDICLSDTHKDGIPAAITYVLDGKTLQIKTRILPNFGVARPQVGRGDFVANEDFKAVLGTVACAVQDDQNNTYLVTCNHVLNGGAFEAPDDLGATVGQLVARQSYIPVGTWAAGQMTSTMDAALIKLDDPDYADPNELTLPTYPVTADDQSQTMVGLVGAQSGIRGGYIIHVNQPFYFLYQGVQVEIDQLISLSSSTIDSNFTPITDDGDSGSLVYHGQTRQPIGMIVGANTQFSFAIPIDSVLTAFPNYHLSIAT